MNNWYIFWKFYRDLKYNVSHKDPYSESYGFSSSQVWMWELDHKESWALNNWCFWGVVLEKSPLDCKEIKPVNPKGNQCWTCVGRADAKAEAPILWPPEVKGGGEGDNRGWNGWMASSTWWTWVWASSWRWSWTGKPGVPQSMGL